MIIIVSILNLLTPINLTFYYMCIMINKFKAFDKSPQIRMILLISMSKTVLAFHQ